MLVKFILCLHLITGALHPGFEHHHLARMHLIHVTNNLTLCLLSVYLKDCYRAVSHIIIFAACNTTCSKNDRSKMKIEEYMKEMIVYHIAIISKYIE